MSLSLVNAQFFSSSFTSHSQFLNEDSLQLFWCGGKLPSIHVSLNRFFSFSSPFLCCWCFASDLPFLTISSIFLSREIFWPIHASGSNKSNLSCWRRKYRKPLMYLMVISRHRRGGGEQQRVRIVEEEEIMVHRYLDSFTQTVTTSNGSDGGTKGWGREAGVLQL